MRSAARIAAVIAAAGAPSAAYPGTVRAARANRAFLARAVRYLAGEAGIGQFLDVGTGIPTAGNTHEVAQAAAPECRIVYVDNDRCKSGCTHARRAGPGGLKRTWEQERSERP